MDSGHRHLLVLLCTPWPKLRLVRLPSHLSSLDFEELAEVEVEVRSLSGFRTQETHIMQELKLAPRDKIDERDMPGHASAPYP